MQASRVMLEEVERGKREEERRRKTRERREKKRNIRKVMKEEQTRVNMKLKLLTFKDGFATTVFE